MQQLIESPFDVSEVSARLLRAERQAFEFGRVYDSYFTTENGWKRFWSAEKSGLVSYRRLRKYINVIGGLLARADEKPRLLQEFMDFARPFKATVTFCNVEEQDLELFKSHGFHVTKWGEEPIVDLQTCTWTGKPYEWVRRQSNFCRRAGITVVEHHPDDMSQASWDALMSQIRSISQELLGTKAHADHIQLVEGQLEVGVWGRRRLFVAYSPGVSRRIEGFVIALPMLDGRRYSFEMYRHRPDAVRGVVPHIFHEAMLRMKSEGVESVSLCLLPGLGSEEQTGLKNIIRHKILMFCMQHLKFPFDFAGLYHFKSRFRPRYEGRYVCTYPKSTPLSTLAFFKLTGLLTFNWRQIGKSLMQMVFKRNERRNLADPDSAPELRCQEAKTSAA
jgi:phosphatidylglycerol lysyltransferase